MASITSITSITRDVDYAYDNDVEVTHLALNHDLDGYYLEAKFKVENKHTVKEIDVPKIRFTIDKNKLSITEEGDPCWGFRRTWIDFGFGRLPLEYGMSYGHPALYSEKILEEKYTEMTMDEIEKKLGYKVKIVNK